MSGGVSYYVYNLSKKIVEKGHNVVVYTRGSLKKRDSECVDGIKVHRVPYLPLYPFHVHIHGIFVNQILRNMEDNFDLVHLHIPLPPYIRTSLPVIVTVHGVPELKSRFFFNYSLHSLAEILFSSIVYDVEKRIFNEAIKITSVSNATARELEHFFGIDNNIVEIVGNGVDTDFFIPGKHDETATGILYVGRLDHKKGLFELIEGAKTVCKEHRDTIFTIAGSGPISHHLKSLVDKYKLSDNFSFIGHVDREALLKHYQNASIFILPSYYEGMPNSILEAMACGLPIIATNVGGIPDVVVHGKNGLLIPPGDSNAIAAAIIRLKTDSQLRERMGTLNRKCVEKFYSWDRISEKFIELYQQVVGF
jgi:glycosyltransferase involved in cell wall biosynthesis